MTTPTPTPLLADWHDSTVQVAYRILCDDRVPPNSDEHWEGYCARRIIAEARQHSEQRARDLKQECERLRAALPLVRRIVKTIDDWNADPDRRMDHPFTELAKSARTALEETK